MPCLHSPQSLLLPHTPLLCRPVLLGRALPVLLAAQQAVGHVMTPFTCIK